VRIRQIPYGHQSVTWREAFAVARAVKAEWMTMGPAVADFEKRLAALSGSDFAIAVSSGSAALHCAYAAIGLGPGDEIITSPMTFVSTAATAMNLGAKVVFADVEPDTGNIDPVGIERLITPRTKAIVVVDYAGHPPDLDQIILIARKHGLVVIEDAAHSIGSLYKGRPIGSVADITTFSFFPTKNITTGEGGAVLTSNEGFALGARRFRSHGMVRESVSLVNKTEGPWHQEVHSLGLNYRLPDVLATLGSGQLERIVHFKKKRQVVFDSYAKELADVEGLSLPVVKGYADPMWHLFPIRVAVETRRSIFEQLRSAGVLAQVNYIPVHWHPVFQNLGHSVGSFPVAEDFYRREISLPMFSGLTKRDVGQVVRALKSALQGSV
jgi:dTDP-4-amino-4,6-dideoxygalactose transaminase